MKSKISCMHLCNLTDINECVEGCQCDPAFGNGHSCVVECVNTPGSFECICNEGYTLATDQRTCVGKFKSSLNRMQLICNLL